MLSRSKENKRELWRLLRKKDNLETSKKKKKKEEKKGSKRSYRR